MAQDFANGRLSILAPQAAEFSLVDRWEKSVVGVDNLIRKGLNSLIILGVDNLIQKGLNSLIILGAWTLWNHRTRCVFNGVSPSIDTALQLACEELQLWGLEAFPTSLSLSQM